MRSFVKHSIILILGATALKGVYAKGYSNGVKQCGKDLQFVIDILKAAEGKES